MSRVCDLTGKKGLVGNRVSHAKNRTKMKQNVSSTTVKWSIDYPLNPQLSTKNIASYESNRL